MWRQIIVVHTGTKQNGKALHEILSLNFDNIVIMWYWDESVESFFFTFTYHYHYN